MALTHTDIYTAVYKMTAADLSVYRTAWGVRHAGKNEFWNEHIEPYTDPPYMLFSAPVTNHLRSLFDLIATINGFSLPPYTIHTETSPCTGCSLAVTHTLRNLCLNCYEKHLDETT